MTRYPRGGISGGGGGGGKSANANATAMAAAAATSSDPAVLLARGYTARYLGAILSGKISALGPDEIDRDLRHITAYQQAATRYHQLTYAATNRLAIPSTSDPNHTTAATTAATATASASAAAAAAVVPDSYAVLPVRIDPDAEKRIRTAAKRIQRAEAVREELEQHYVALRAHYVVTAQELQQRTADLARTVEFLQGAVAPVAVTLGLQRARLQMVRDARAALHRRTSVLAPEEGPTPMIATATTTNSTPATTPTLAAMTTTTATTTTTTTTDPSVYVSGADSSSSCPMLAAWLAVEDDCRQRYATRNAAGGDKKRTTKSTTNVVPWSCTVQPSTARNVPQLVSATATVPEKSLAVQTGGIFGSHESSLTWLESHLPPLADADTTGDWFQVEGSAVDGLRKEVSSLERELLQERETNQALLVTTSKARTQHDEWVSMIALVRQETEAVLHRHNILLESDEVMDAAAAAAAAAHDDDDAPQDDDDDVEDEMEEEEEEEDGGEEEEVLLDEEGGALVPTAADSRTLKPLPDEEGASEADDEGMEEEGEDVDDWDTNTNNNNSNKRSAVAANEDSDESPGESRKRRKV